MILQTCCHTLPPNVREIKITLDDINVDEENIRSDRLLVAGIMCADATGRFYRKYPVVAPAGREFHVAEIIRLRYRITDPPEFLVEKLERVSEKHREAREWIFTTFATDTNSVDEVQPPSSTSLVDWAPEITFDDKPVSARLKAFMEKQSSLPPRQIEDDIMF